MLLFSPDSDRHPLIVGLNKMPAAPTLVEFKDLLKDLFIDIHREAPAFFETKKRDDKPSYLAKLARAFECDPTVRKPTKVKNEALNGSIRTIRHMIYSHDAIKDGIDSEQKKISISRLTRVQILLAKRLSTLRIIKEQREHILSLEIKQIEELLILEDADLKEKISKGIPSQSTAPSARKKKAPPAEQPVWQRRSRPTYHLKLAHGLTLEIDDRAFRAGDQDTAKKALSKYLELMLQIDPKSEEGQELITQIIKASPQY